MRHEAQQVHQRNRSVFTARSRQVDRSGTRHLQRASAPSSARKWRQATRCAWTASSSARRRQHIYIALNKPAGITCTTDRNIEDNIIEFVGHSERIFPIGRLDKDSEGLILLTNNGDIVNEILRSENNHEKEYVVTVNRPITDLALSMMASGVRIMGATTKPCGVSRVDSDTFRLTLTQGLNRQIRRMCSALGYRVQRLRRVRVINIELGTLGVRPMAVPDRL